MHESWQSCLEYLKKFSSGLKKKKKLEHKKFVHRLRWYFLSQQRELSMEGGLEGWVTPGMDYSNDNKTNSWQTQIDELSLPSTRETTTEDKSNSRFWERTEMQGLILKPVLKQLGNRGSQKFWTNLVCFFPPRTLEPFCQWCSSLWTLRLGEGDGEGKNGKGKSEGMKESLYTKNWHHPIPPPPPPPSSPSPPLATFSLFPRTKVPCQARKSGI